jgi:hypothetical protein
LQCGPGFRSFDSKEGILLPGTDDGLEMEHLLSSYSVELGAKYCPSGRTKGMLAASWAAQLPHGASQAEAIPKSLVTGKLVDT